MIRSEFPARAGNRRLKNELFYSVWFEAIHDPVPTVYYDRKRADRQRRGAAVIWLPCHHCNVIFAVLGDSTCYQPPTAPTPRRPLPRRDPEYGDTPLTYGPD